ncbi:MAG: hypothetical protein CMJ62_13515 [Planctomycetaceae bacterium]|nr:hypothetical protein [Planctomycetaceae bacterium]
MKITDLEIGGFGVWKGLNLNDLSGKLTIIYGCNEAGKTTLMQFVRSALYGLQEQRRARYLPPVYGGRPGGALRLKHRLGEFRLQRYLSHKGSGIDREEIGVTDSEGRVQPDNFLEKLLSGIDEAIFTNVFAIGLRELQELGALNDSDAAQHLYAVAGGVDRVSLIEVRRELIVSRDRLFHEEKPQCLIRKLLQRRREHETKIRHYQEETRSWAQRRTGEDDLTSQIAATKEDLAQVREEVGTHEAAMSVQEKWQQRAALDDRLSKISPVGQIAYDAVDRLGELKKSVRRFSRRQSALKVQMKQLRRRRKQITLNRSLLKQRSRIESLDEQQAWATTVQSQITRIEGEIKELQHKVELEKQRLGDATQDADSPPLVSRQAVMKLRKAADAVREGKRRLSAAKQYLERGENLRERDAEQLESLLKARGERDLLAAVETAGRLVELLRRRIELDERLQQLKRHERDLEEASRDQLRRKVLTNHQIGLVGAVFSLGFVLLLTSLFGWMPVLGLLAGTRWVLAFLGLGCLVGAAVSKSAFEQAAQSRWKDCQQQSRSVTSQVAESESERKELDEQLPVGGGPLVVRMKNAEADLEKLQKLLPFDAERQTASSTLDADQQRIAGTQEGFKDARGRWRRLLVSNGLSAALKPADLDVVARQSRRIRELQRQIGEKSKELEQRRHEISTVAERINHLLAETGVAGGGGDALEQFEALNTALADQVKRVERRNDLKRQDQKLKHRYLKCSRNIEDLRRRLRGFFSDAGVSGEREFRAAAGEAKRSYNLRRQRDELTQQIGHSLGSQVSEETITELLGIGGQADVEQRLEQLWDRQQEYEQELNTLHEKRGQLKASVEQSRLDRRIAAELVDLGCVNEQLRVAFHRWKMLAVASRILDVVCENYEAQRQPETLQDASQHLEQLTEGKYVRIWTPLTEDVLLVQDHQGQSLSAETLSSGAREQVFLSLRLALTALFSRRGMDLPMVLDDVLVNFDVQRSRAAARVLRDFAKEGHQIILFTCHEHIMKMFRALRVDVRTLPDYRELAQGEVVQSRRKRRKTRDHGESVERLEEKQLESAETVTVENAEVNPTNEEFPPLSVEEEIQNSPCEMWESNVTWHAESLEPVGKIPESYATEKELTGPAEDSQENERVEYLVVHAAHKPGPSGIRGQRAKEGSMEVPPGGTQDGAT